MTIFNQSVVRVRAGEREGRGGDKILDWSAAAVHRTDVDHLSVQPNFQREETDGGGSVARSTGLRVLSDPGHPVPDINSLDRIEYRGETYAVSGEVAYWPDPQGRDHIEFTATGWKGK